MIQVYFVQNIGGFQEDLGDLFGNDPIWLAQISQ